MVSITESGVNFGDFSEEDLYKMLAGDEELQAKLFEENEVSMEDILKCDGEESIGRFMIFYAGDFHDICFFNTVEGVTNEFDRAMENSSSSDEVYYIQDVWDLDDTNYSESKTLRNILGFVFNTTVL